MQKKNQVKYYYHDAMLKMDSILHSWIYNDILLRFWPRVYDIRFAIVFHVYLR